MIAVLVNPTAGRGRAGMMAPRVMEALQSLDDIVPVETQARGDEAQLAALAAAQGARLLVIVGGDGSVHHATRGLLAGTSRLPVAIIAAGTGNDFVKSLGTPAHDLHAMVSRIVRGHTRSVDVGLVDDVPFLNAAGLGFDVEVLERMHTSSALSGTSAYVVTALKALLGYRGFDALLTAGPAGHASGTEHPSTARSSHLMTVFANGRCFGGAFHIAPHARLDDGALDVIDIGVMPWWKRPALFLRAMRGSHLHSAYVRQQTVQRFHVHCQRPPTFEADGELYRASSCDLTITVRPGAIECIV